MAVRRITDSIRYRGGLVAAAVLPELLVSAVTVAMRHKAKIGAFPNILKPKTFNERVLHRMLFDRRPILTQLQDKYAVRDYVRERLGEGVLPKLYWVTKHPSDIPFDDLPRAFVVKPTHASAWYRLVSDKAALDRQALIERCEFWLTQNYYLVEREWVYKHIEPRILVEEYVNDGTGPDPVRYKIFVFHGNARIIEVGVGTPGQARCGFYGRSWDKLPAFFPGWREIDGELARPKHLADMLAYAETLAGGLDFIRVDLYDTDAKVYFGELTTCPGGGTTLYSPPAFDRDLGEMWSA
ncbi:MAG TPA: ATP-grasp fold amidoligase family protein [bacterium]|nr:ATP-grasp fold amidoligase family protein [bacterium]